MANRQEAIYESATNRIIEINNGKKEIAQKLIEHGADVIEKNNNGQTLLDLCMNPDYYMTKEKKQAIITLLRKHAAKTSKELSAEAKAKPQKDNK